MIGSLGPLRPGGVKRGWPVAILAAACALSVGATWLPAQSGDTTRARERRDGNARTDDQRTPENRRAMIEQMQLRIERLLRERLQLTDSQAVRLRAVGTRMDIARRKLGEEESDFRRALRKELTPGVTPNEVRISRLMDRWPVLERSRIALQEQEQKELASFLQPIQRARFFALQDELRRAKQEQQWGRRVGPPQMRDSTGRPPFRDGPRRPPPPKDSVKR